MPPNTSRTEWDAVIDAEVENAPPLTAAQAAALTVLFDWTPENGGGR
jgi:hypothetical protein